MVSPPQHYAGVADAACLTEANYLSCGHQILRLRSHSRQMKTKSTFLFFFFFCPDATHIQLFHLSLNVSVLIFPPSQKIWAAPRPYVVAIRTRPVSKCPQSERAALGS